MSDPKHKDEYMLGKMIAASVFMTGAKIDEGGGCAFCFMSGFADAFNNRISEAMKIAGTVKEADDMLRNIVVTHKDQSNGK